MAVSIAMSGAMSACATSSQESMRVLQESLEAYNDAYRWKNYERAATFVPSDLRGAFLATYEDEENGLHIEDYQILRVDMEGEKAATAVVRVRFMLLPSVTVQKTTLVQHWARIGGSWILETEDGSIRELEMGKKPRNPDAFGRDGDDVDDGHTKVKVESPTGEVLREDKDVEEDPAEEPGEDAPK
jgi:hypothetical protein